MINKIIKPGRYTFRPNERHYVFYTVDKVVDGVVYLTISDVLTRTYSDTNQWLSLYHLRRGSSDLDRVIRQEMLRKVHQYLPKHRVWVKVMWAVKCRTTMQEIMERI